MGVYIDLYKINKEKLYDKTLELYPKSDRGYLREIFHYFMTDCGEFFILLNNEYYEEVNPDYNMIYAIDAKYGYKDWQSKVLLNKEVSTNVSKSTYHDRYEIDEKFNIESNENGDY